MRLQIIPVIDRKGVRYQVKQLGFFNHGKWLCLDLKDPNYFAISEPNRFLSYKMIKRFDSVNEAIKTIHKLYGHTDFTLEEWIGK